MFAFVNVDIFLAFFSLFQIIHNLSDLVFDTMKNLSNKLTFPVAMGVALRMKCIVFNIVHNFFQNLIMITRLNMIISKNNQDCLHSIYCV